MIMILRIKILPTGIPAAAVAAKGATKTVNNVAIPDAAVNSCSEVSADSIVRKLIMCFNNIDGGVNLGFNGRSANVK